jgi:hypothetical protein
VFSEELKRSHVLGTGVAESSHTAVLAATLAVLLAVKLRCGDEILLVHSSLPLWYRRDLAVLPVDESHHHSVTSVSSLSL